MKHPPQKQPAKDKNASGLFEKCLARERALKQVKFLELKEALVSAFLNRPLCESDPSAAPEMRQLATYLVLRKALKDAKNNEERWCYLARWLKQESICEPNQFLPKATYRQLTVKYRKRLKGISFTDPFYFELVRTWEPYFERLLDDRKNSRDLQKLASLGYSRESVNLVITKSWRSAVDVSCEWLAQREVVSTKRKTQQDVARTLRNAYSRVKTIASRSPFQP